MLFSSLIFLFAFLPAVLAGYYAILALTQAFTRSPLAARKLGNLWLLLGSLLFYAWGEPLLTTVMLVATAISYVGALLVARARQAAAATTGSADGAGKSWLVVTTVVMLGLLAFFKYANFGVENFNLLVAVLGKPEWRTGVLAIALPLGISFYTFQALSYVIDVYRGDVPATRSFVDFACYVTMSRSSSPVRSGATSTWRGNSWRGCTRARGSPAARCASAWGSPRRY
jgi:alginate O-acetyltransferase complex protein AlgI